MCLCYCAPPPHSFILPLPWLVSCAVLSATLQGTFWHFNESFCAPLPDISALGTHFDSLPQPFLRFSCETSENAIQNTGQIFCSFHISKISTTLSQLPISLVFCPFKFLKSDFVFRTVLFDQFLTISISEGALWQILLIGILQFNNKVQVFSTVLEIGS